LCLAARVAFGTDVKGYAREFGGKGVELVHHGVDGVLQLQDFALDVYRHFLTQVAVGDGGGHFRDVADLAGQVAGHRVHGVGEVSSEASSAAQLRTPPGPANGTE